MYDTIIFASVGTYFLMFAMLPVGITIWENNIKKR